MSKQAYLIMGPEASGTRFLTRAFVKAGCEGTADHRQPFDRKLPRVDKLVWRRSFPHARVWPNIPRMWSRLNNKGYEVSVFIMVRDGAVLRQSQVRARHVSTLEEADRNIEKAYRLMLQVVTALDLSCKMVSYEGIVLHHASLSKLLGTVGLSPIEMNIRDGNRKYYV